jgi:hypothetical protein
MSAHDLPDNIAYSVILGVDAGSPLGQLLKGFGTTITFEDGSQLLNLWCSRVDASHHVYLEVVAYKPSTQQESHLRVPHQMVLLISDPYPPQKGIGFLS